MMKNLKLLFQLHGFGHAIYGGLVLGSGQIQELTVPKKYSSEKSSQKWPKNNHVDVFAKVLFT